MRASASLVLLLVASSGLAQEGLEYGFGTGRLGAVTVNARLILNPCTGVRSLTGTTLDVDSALAFVAGDLVLVHHTQAAGDGGVGDLSSSTVGRYFFRRVTAVASNRLTLDRPVEALTAGAVQVVRVLEAERLRVVFGSVLEAPPWDGRCGGIVAALVADTFDLDGVMTAEGRGFRGGAAVPMGTAMMSGCVPGGSSAVAPGFAPAGEGLADDGPAPLNVATTTGGAGGVCRFSGGGGGGNVGRGGVGGQSSDGRAVGGAGGAPAGVDPLRRAFFGGGGGAAHREPTTARGGSGGGFVWVRARTLSSTFNGRLLAGGRDGEQSQNGGGGGGGGAGGTIVLQLGAITGNNGLFSATGGTGGWVFLASGSAGPGGSGSGGVISVWAPVTVESDASGGPSPVFRRLLPDGGDESQGARGAAAGGLGRSETILAAFALPDAGLDAGSLELIAPREAEVLRTRRPRVAGVGEPGTPVALSLDGQPLATLAPGLDGAFEAAPAVDLADGPHEVVAQQGALTVQRRFVTDVSAPAAPLISSPRARAIFSESPGVVRGGAEAGARVRIFFDEAPEAGEVLADADGGFTFLVASALPDGDHTVSAVAEDAAGNVSERSEAVPFKVSSRLERPMDAMVRSGCEAAPAVSLLLGLLAWAARRRRRGA